MTALSLRSIDVGFDLAILDMAVTLDLGVHSVDTDWGTVSGSPLQIAAALQKHGFTIRHGDRLLLPSVNGCPAVEYVLEWEPGDDAFDLVRRVDGGDGDLVEGYDLEQVILNQNGKPSEWLMRYVDVFGPGGFHSLRPSLWVDEGYQGREIRYVRARDTFEVQPPHDNYWSSFATLDEAKRFATSG